MVSNEKIKKLIEYAKIVCDSASDSPCGCDGCRLSSEGTYDEDGEFSCPMYEVISEIKEQMGEK